MTITTSSPTPDALLYSNDDSYRSLEEIAAQLHISTGQIRELIATTAPDVLRRKILRLVEDRWLTERWLVSVVDVERLVSLCKKCTT